MNFLKTTDNGGFPFVLDDLRWEADAVREALAELNTVWGDNYILRGCVITDAGANYDITAGAIVLDGEVHIVDAGSVAKPAFGQDLVFASSETFDPNGLKTFESGASFNTYVIKKAVLSYDTAPTSGFEALTAVTVQSKLVDVILGQVNLWTDYSGTTSIYTNTLGAGQGTNVFLNGIGSFFVKYSITGKTVTVDISLIGVIIKRADDGDAASVVITLPEAVKPKNVVVGAVFSAYCVAASFGDKNKCYAGTIEHYIDPSSFDGTEGKLCLRNWSDTSQVLLFNREYEFDTAPSRLLVATAVTNMIPTWNFFGSFSYELE